MVSNQVWSGMAFVSGLRANCSGLTHCHPKLTFKTERPPSTRCSDYKAFQLPARLIQRTRVKYTRLELFATSYAMSGGRSGEAIHHQLTSDDDSSEESFWVSLMKEAFWGLKSLLAFLVEQPSQLKYIEWPSFQSTLMTATFTLVLVAVLIVALSSVDSALCYILALILRRTP